MPQKKYLKIVSVIFIIFFVFGKMIFVNNVNAQGGSDPSALFFTPPVGGIATYDATQQAELENLRLEANKEANKTWLTKLKDTARAKKKEIMLGTWSEAMSSALQVFSRQVAYNVAMKLAKGGAGGQPLTWGTAWPDYIEKAGQAAVGDFIGNLSNLTGYNLCDPGKLGKIDMVTKIVMDIASPPKPRCDWKDIASNWQTMDQGKFLDKLSHEFDPDTNDLGTYFALKGKLETNVNKNVEIADRLRGSTVDVGFRSVNNTISGAIKTPNSIIKDLAVEPLKVADATQQTNWLGKYITAPFMNDILAPGVETFLTTLSGQLMNKWLNKGMFDYSAYDAYKAIFSPSGSGTNVASNQALQNEYGSIMNAKFIAGGNYDIVSDFATCPYNENASPNNCVIDQNFSLAIEQKMTVGDALNAGFLNKDGTFGFEANGEEPAYNEGYPFRSMKILRKYRILPVGWEIAAEYINKFANTKRYSLQQMVDCYSPSDEWNKTGTGNTEGEWCQGLVDPDWLLKAPANNCEKKALAGQVITSEQVIDGTDNNNDGFYYNKNSDTSDDNDKPAAMSVMRDEFCAVDKSCINETADGKCLKWGYCTEEKRIWRLKGETCDETFNTCQTFTPSSEEGAGGGSSAVSYLKNTLDYGICDASNAGCKWYCADYDYSAKDWKCYGDKTPLAPLSERGESSIGGNEFIFFNKNAEKCDEKNEGCHEFIRLGNNVNLIYDGNLEEGDQNQKLEIGNSKLAEGQTFNYWPVEKSLNGSITISMDNGAAKIETSEVGAGIYSYDAVGASEKNYSMMPEGYAFDDGKNYLLSADVFVEKGKVEIGFENPAVNVNEWARSESKENGKWERIQVFLASGKYAPSKIYIHNSSLGNDSKAIFSIDNISLYEAGDQLSALSYYKNYGDDKDKIKIKKAPAYLACDTASAKSECSNYAAQCSASEVGCSKYTPVSGEPWISAIISDEDKCDKECVNYKSYKASATNFSRELPDVKFIADNPYAQGLGGAVCSAEVMGCSEFTNLDELEKGGEQKEYYTYLKQCAATDKDGKPVTAETLCGTFYTWQGSDTNGLQLKTYYLEKNLSGAPVMINNPRDLGKCEGADDVKNNQEHCKEFYDEQKVVSYAILENTVTCSENCHPYRKTKEDISRSACLLDRSSWIAVPAVEISSPAAAKALSGECSGSDCVCKLEIENCVYSGGKWKDGGCVYMAIPDEGIKCDAADNGCNEYKGSSSGNIKIVLKNDFEDKTNGGWTNGSPSNEAYVGGEQSLTLAAGASVNYVQKDLGGILKKDKSYEISFLANNISSSEKVLTVALAGVDFYAVRKITLAANSLPWQRHIASSLILAGDLNEDGQINADDLTVLNRAAADKMSVTARQRELADIDGSGDITGEDADLLSVFISAARPSAQLIVIGGIDANIFIDNIVLTEVQENIYRIKDTWTVPDKCDSPTFAAQLGCAEYNDINGNLVQLKSFNNVCSAKAVGCEMMIDTQNSSSAFPETFNTADASATTVLRDKIAYMVNSHPCNSKGCQKFGAPNLSQDKASLNGYSSDVYLVNDPNKYGSILCLANALWCEEYNWSSGASSGTAYFKDPKEKVCEFKDGEWYKISSPPQSPQGTAACADGTTQSPSGDCGGEELCPVAIDANLTIGSAPVDVPKDGWTGICPAKQSGCEEIIDPLSDNEPNIVFNGNFEQDAQALSGGTGDGPDGWTNILGCKAGADSCCANGFSGTKAIQKGEQEIVLSADALYTVSARVNGTGRISINNCEILSPDNSMAISGNSAVLAFSNMPLPMNIKSGRFYIKGISAAGSCVLNITTGTSSGGFVDDVNIQKTGIYYYLADSINGDECISSNPSKGCILVNERQFKWDSAAGVPSHKDLTESADKAYGGGNSSCANDASCVPNANRLIKADPDRVCGKWLVETNHEKTEDGEFKTRTIGECVAADASGACTRPVVEEQHDVNFKKGSVSLMKNISGLSKVGFEWNEWDDEKKVNKVNKIEGYYPLSAMPQIGQYIDLPGGFELAILNGKNGTKPDDAPKWWKPAGWDLDGDGNWWEGFEAIVDPVSAQKEGLDKKAPAGKNFLKLNGDYIARLSEELPVYEGVPYTITGYINTRGIQTPKTKSGIYLEALDSAGRSIVNGSWKLEISEGRGWTQVAQKIDMPTGARKLQIRLKNENDDKVAVMGSSYFDEITLMPALKKQDAPASFTKEEIAPSICKSYPEQDSFSCEYTKNNNTTYVGERGYCLEYDTPPGDPNVCVNWYPIDVIRGEEGKEVASVTFAGYGKGPLYYCLEGQFLESRKPITVVVDGSFSGASCADYIPIKTEHCARVGFSHNCNKRYWCNPQNSTVVDGPVNPPPYSGFRYDTPTNNFPESIYYYNGSLANVYGKSASYKEHFELRCSKIIEAATINGDSQLWTSRLSPQSRYVLDKLSENINDGSLTKNIKYGYWSNVAPYGAISMGQDGSNVSSWDGDPSIDGQQPLNIKVFWDGQKYAMKSLFENDSKNYGMGLPYSCSNPDYGECATPMGAEGVDNRKRSISVNIKNDLLAAQNVLKKLFVRSYGAWQWQNGTSNQAAGYIPAPNNKFDYLAYKEKQEITCPSSTPARPVNVDTWVASNIQNDDVEGTEQCYIPWKWVVEDITIPPASADDLPTTKHIEEYRVDTSVKEDLVCAHGEKLTFKVEDIFANNKYNNSNYNVMPKVEVIGDIEKDLSNNLCYSHDVTYSYVLQNITEERLATEEKPSLENGNTQISDSPDEQIITVIKQKGSVYYQYTIDLAKNITANNKLGEVKCPATFKKVVRENDGKCYNYIYENTKITATWEPPTETCKTPTHVEDESYCGIKPQVKNIKVGEIADKPVNIGIANSVLLTFNTDADPDQQPLMEYYIDWGDGNASLSTGKRFMVQPTYPLVFDHLYGYNEISGKYYNNDSKIINAKTEKAVVCYKFDSDECAPFKSGACCMIKPRIRIKDNWGWCSGKDSIQCSDNKTDWASYGNWIVVTER